MSEHQLTERQVLIHDIDIHLARTPLVIELADLAIAHSNEVSKRIEQGLEDLQAEMADAIVTLRRAGLLTD